VKAPKVGEELLGPVGIDVIKALVLSCKGRAFTGDRDKVIILALIDTGARVGELLAVNSDDLDLSGAILIRQGKGKKPRTVFLGMKSRKAVRTYLKQRDDFSPALWVTVSGERLKYSGLRQIIVRRAKAGGVDPPPLHAYGVKTSTVQKPSPIILFDKTPQSCRIEYLNPTR